MNRIVPILICIAFPFAALAETAEPTAKPDESSIGAKQQMDAPGAKSDTGVTADPTAKPADGSIAQKQLTDQTGATGAGTTDMPTAQPTDSSITEKQKTDQAK